MEPWGLTRNRPESASGESSGYHTSTESLGSPQKTQQFSTGLTHSLQAKTTHRQNTAVSQKHQPSVKILRFVSFLLNVNEPDH